MIGIIPPADPVRSVHVARSGTLARHFGRYFDQQGQVGKQAAATDAVQFEHFRIGQSAAAALVGAA